MKRTPLPDHPTNADLARGQSDLHECLEEHREQTARNFAAMSQRLEAIGERVGVGGRAKSIATMSPQGLIWRIVGSLGAATLLYRIAWAAAPSAWRTIEAINGAILK